MITSRVGLKALVRVAGTRWSIEECFQAGKGEVGLDQHQVRTWGSWHRYTTLAMFAHAILAIIAARERANRPQQTTKLIPLTVTMSATSSPNSSPAPPSDSPTGCTGQTGDATTNATR